MESMMVDYVRVHDAVQGIPYCTMYLYFIDVQLVVILLHCTTVPYYLSYIIIMLSVLDEDESNIIHRQFKMIELDFHLQLTTFNLVVYYLIVEIFFYLLFTFHIKRIANDLSSKSIKPFRDHGQHRHLLFKKILDRMETQCEIEGKHIERELHVFLKNWFLPRPLGKIDSQVLNLNEPTTSNSSNNHSHFFFERKSTSLSSSSSSCIENVEDYTSSFCQEDLREFFAWAFFDKTVCNITEQWEKDELNKMFEMLITRYGFVYQSYKVKESPIRLKPKSMTLEDCNPLHRPIALYMLFWILRYFGYFILYMKGFRRFHVQLKSQGQEKVLYYWLLQNTKNSVETTANLAPTMFFHGIAPAGLTFYIPMLFNSLLRCDKKTGSKPSHQDAIFLFENLPITCSLVFDALTEEQTMHCVEKALIRHGFYLQQQDGTGTYQPTITVCGHSFGSFQVSWLLKHSAIKDKIKQVILLDPVSIMLSEPDVLTNFLYTQTTGSIFQNGKIDAISLMEYIHKMKIRIIASSELGIEYYLRRHFAWYNSELWIEDIPKSINMSVYVSEKDEIIDAEKVVREVTRFPHVKLKLLKNVGHAALITQPALWKMLYEEFSDSDKSKCD